MSSKSYKIKYWISALPDFILTDFRKEDHMILDELAKTDDLSIFTA